MRLLLAAALMSLAALSATPATAQVSIWSAAGSQQEASAFEEPDTERTARLSSKVIRDAYFGALVGAAYGGFMYFAGNEGTPFDALFVIQPAVICGLFGVVIGAVIE